MPTPSDKLVTENQTITAPWYQYLLGVDPAAKTRVDVLTTATGASNIYAGKVTVFNSTPGTVHILEDPVIGSETTLICTVGSTQGNITVQAATDVNINPSGENALVFGTDASTYGYCKLVGVSTSQYHIMFRTTNVSIAASS